MWSILFKIVPLAISGFKFFTGLFKKKPEQDSQTNQIDNTSKKKSKEIKKDIVPVEGDHDGDGELTGADSLIENSRKRAAFREKWLSRINNKFRRI